MLQPVVVATGQHTQPVRKALGTFGLAADIDIKLERSAGTQAELATQLIAQLDGHVGAQSPAAAVVQGDTTSALIGALVAFWRQIPLVHLEAGLRSGDLTSPYPEEANRRLIGQIAQLHLAPTPRAAAHLAAEAITGPQVLITGNTIVDALRMIIDRGRSSRLFDSFRVPGRRLVLVTMHRRESWGAPVRRVLDAVRTIVHDHPDIEVIFPAHPNQALQREIRAALGDQERILVTDPLDYPDLLCLLDQAHMVLSDSGGILEEAVTLGTPVLVLRDVTERTEAVDAGYAQLVGTDSTRIIHAAKLMLAQPAAKPGTANRTNPFGDGHAAARSAQAIAWLLGHADRPVNRPDPASSR